MPNSNNSNSPKSRVDPYTASLANSHEYMGRVFYVVAGLLIGFTAISAIQLGAFTSKDLMLALAAILVIVVARGEFTEAKIIRGR